MNVDYQTEKLPYKEIKKTKNSYIVMYDLECNIHTGIPFWLTFCIYNCILRKILDSSLYKRYYDRDVPVYLLCDKAINIFYAVLKHLLDECSDVGRLFLMAFNGNAYDHLYILNRLQYNYILISGNNIVSCEFKAFGYT